jgi:uncharacterized protein (TIGR02118 family)
MIKFFGLIPRRSDISSQEFHDHYRHPHGTLGRQIPTFRDYVQSYQIHSPLLGPDQTRFEAVAEVWFDTVGDAGGQLWWPTVSAFEAGAAADGALDELLTGSPEAVALLAQAERFL